LGEKLATRAVKLAEPPLPQRRESAYEEKSDGS
jgi:hypothetical protein